MVVSYDRRPGLVSSACSARRAAACAVAFPDSPLPRAELTGAPIRQAIIDARPGSRPCLGPAALGLPADRFVVAVMGGSLGAGCSTTPSPSCVDRCADRRDLAVHHVVG